MKTTFSQLAMQSPPFLIPGLTKDLLWLQEIPALPLNGKFKEE